MGRHLGSHLGGQWAEMWKRGREPVSGKLVDVVRSLRQRGGEEIVEGLAQFWMFNHVGFVFLLDFVFPLLQVGPLLHIQFLHRLLHDL